MIAFSFVHPRDVPKQEKILIHLAVQKVMRDEVLKSFHESVAGCGHQGYEHTYAALWLKYFWLTMWEDTHWYVQSCKACQQSKRDVHTNPPPLNPMPVADLFQR